MIDPVQVADKIIDQVASTDAGSEIAASVNVGSWNAEQTQSLFNALLEKFDANGLRLRGVRADTHSFAKLGIVQDCANAGTYKGVNVVITPSVDFDTLEFVLQRGP